MLERHTLNLGRAGDFVTVVMILTSVPGLSSSVWLGLAVWSASVAEEDAPKPSYDHVVQKVEGHFGFLLTLRWFPQ